MRERLYQLGFWVLLLGYIIFYAPYGINDTDGGFITAYGWRILQGELPYVDFIYVRPPLSIYWRSLELWLLPDHLEIIAERVGFYLKIGLYSWLAAAILLRSSGRWLVAGLGFILSVHNYPAAAWHTIDGIFFSVLAFWCLFNWRRGLIVASICVFLAMACKQSFYPLLPLFLLIVGLYRGWRALLIALVTWLGCFGLAWGVAQYAGVWPDLVQQITASTSSGQALERGLYDYFRLDVRLWGLILLVLPFWWLRRRRWLNAAMAGFVLALCGSYCYSIYQNETFTAPVGQSRLLFLIALAYGSFSLFQLLRQQGSKVFRSSALHPYLQFFSLLGISWMAAISWGYNFPILFSAPLVFGCYWMVKERAAPWLHVPGGLWHGILVIVLVSTFRFAYEYVYRDGQRADLNMELSIVFPKLKHIYSDPQTFEKYRELKQLRQKYGDRFKTMPSFPLSNYLTETTSPLAIDWVFNSETNGQNEKLYERINARDIHFFIEREAIPTIKNNGKYEVSKYILDNLERIDETRYFYVYK